MSDNGTANTGNTAVDSSVVDTTNIENFYVRNLDANANAQVNATGWDGAEQVWYNRGTEGVDVTSVAALVTAGINEGAGAASDFDIQYTSAAVSGAADEQSVVLTDADAGDVSVDDTTAAGGIETFSVQATGTNTVADLQLGTDAESISFLGAGDLTINTALDNVTTIDGSAATGDLDLTAGSNVETFNTGTGDDTVTTVAATTALDTGAGDDTATLVDPTAELVADFGAGDDTVDARSNGVDFTNTDISLDGGAGSDTIDVGNTDIADLTAAAASRATVTGFEVLATSGLTSAEDFDISDVAEGFNQLVSDATDDVTVSGFADGGTVTLTGQQVNGGATFAVEGAGDAGRNDDTFNIGLADETDADTFDVTVAEVENINITSTDDDDGDDVNELSLVANDATDVTASGDEDLDLTDAGANNSSFNSLQTLDANGLSGELTVELSTANQGVVVTAGSGGSDITGSGNSDIINAGAGADSITAGDGADEIKLTADGETDTIVYGDANEGSAVGAAGGTFSGQDAITGFVSGDTGDEIDVSGFVTGGTTEEGQLTAQETAADDDVYIVDASANFVDGGSETIADLTDVDDVVAYMQEGVDASGFSSGEQMLFAFSNVNGETGIYAYTDDGATNAIQADEVTLLGVSDNAEFTAADLA